MADDWIWTLVFSCEKQRHHQHAWAVVVALWSLPTSEVRGSNPVLSEILLNLFTTNCIDENKEKRGWEKATF